ncbi:MAG: hypoxanthine phosphoribosyltransferase [Sandaracinaceae bacterium]|nr:hypoxanthine phosphoribosyltransferase [Sandaracinaceae bacterium]
MPDIDTLIDAETIAQRVKELGAQITKEHAGEELVLVPVLNGSFVFAADLARAIDLPLSIDFFGCRSYEGTSSTGVVQTTLDLSHSIEGKVVIVVEDIVDTGLTMAYMLDNLRTRRPAKVHLASLLSKPARRKIEVDIDYLGFEIEDVFVIGYGLDFDELYRNLPYLGVLRT